MADLALAAPRIASDAEAFRADAAKGAHAVAAGGVEADKDAEGLEDGGFSLGIVTDEDGSSGRDFDFQRGKAAEIGESQRVEHADQGGVMVKGPEVKKGTPSSRDSAVKWPSMRLKATESQPASTRRKTGDMPGVEVAKVK